MYVYGLLRMNTNMKLNTCNVLVVSRGCFVHKGLGEPLGFYMGFIIYLFRIYLYHCFPA